MKKLKLIRTILFVIFVFGINSSASAKSTIFLKRKNPFLPQLPGIARVVKMQPQREIPKKPNVPSRTVSPAGTEKNKINHPVAPRTPVPSLRVSGLIWNSDRPQAIINSQVVDEGDEIQSVKILSISKKGVDILFQGAEMMLKL